MTVVKRPFFVDSREFAEEDQLTLKGRLQAIEHDPLAGFLPTTHREKNQTLQILANRHPSDDERLLPLQVITEIGDHQLKTYHRRHNMPFGKTLNTAEHRERFKERDEAKTSVVLEWSDYMTNAALSIGGLKRVAKTINDCPNPKAYLIEELDEGNQATADAALLLRYIEGLEVRQNGLSGEEPFDPLATVVRRIEDPATEKHKMILDEYSLEEPTSVVEAQISNFVEGSRIGGLRSVAKEALLDQEHRFGFWESVMEELGRNGGLVRPLAQTALLELPFTVR